MSGSATHSEHDPADEARARCRFAISGRVQGVGFRPFVYRLATELQLGGFVCNDPQGVIVELEASPDQIEQFERRLRDELPPLAEIHRLDRAWIEATGERLFRIQPSTETGPQKTELTPDVATCSDCLRELFDPGDRRYRYPFINCTNCGPRYSIIQGVPYDRSRTTMSVFRMCPQCQAEYDNPLDRRFHAQPNACPVCGPSVRLVDRDNRSVAGDAIAECARRIHEGRIAAIKGLGGFHLACDAVADESVRELRERKGRDTKPLAVMVASLAAARELAEINDAAAYALQSPARPIVLAPMRAGAPISHHVAPGCDSLGLMLPYTPIHHLLFADGLGPTVMTSGNPSEEPLCRDDTEALQRLAGIADMFLLHNRGIERRVDDSVVVAVESPAPTIVQVRRARGYAPAPIHVDEAAPRPILAVGGELKSTVALYSDRTIVLSEHLGELSNPLAYRHFSTTIERLQTLLRIEPAIVACDLHPDYAATRFAQRLPLHRVPVQHHHAHLVGCMADNGLSGPVVGIICDGTGYGTDGAIWGCEVLVGEATSFQRAAHLDYYPLIGGDRAAKETWRPAMGLLYTTFGDRWRQAAAVALKPLAEEEVAVVEKRISLDRGVVPTSSLGRLFDAVAFLLGICSQNGHEAQAAMAVEAAARSYAGGKTAALSCPVVEPPAGSNQPATIDPRHMIESIVAARAAAVPATALAAAFHDAIAVALVDAGEWAARSAGIDRVVLSGGCFFNRLLLKGLTARLTARGLRVFCHQRVPAGDGGLALGQAVAAAAKVE